MKEDPNPVGKFGTDSRFPHWRGGAIDPQTINGYSAIGILVNWGYVIFAYSGPFNSTETEATLWPTILLFLLVPVICFLTSRLIRHHKPKIQLFVRLFVSGLPVLIGFIFPLLFLLYIATTKFFNID